VDAITQFDDPVLAYDRLSRIYAMLVQKRARYLAAVEREILRRIPAGASSLLDVGAGDGSRAIRISSQAGITRIVLAEPSEKMLPRTPDGVGVWRDRAEELGNRQSSEKFDVITCLWNVLGHIPGITRRARALNAVRDLLSENGRFFLDVTHRYNTRSYGLVPTAARLLHDFFVRRETNGDMIVNWDIGDARISTYGHVFTQSEVVQLAHNSGSKLEERLVIDYEDGEICGSCFQGNLLYVFRRSN
jgi:2-polyprenyl-3-methyl-5-hydroxy-6-metoxy-1,4-benzoquinol methylase